MRDLFKDTFGYTTEKLFTVEHDDMRDALEWCLEQMVEDARASMGTKIRAATYVPFTREWDKADPGGDLSCRCVLPVLVEMVRGTDGVWRKEIK